MRCILTAFSPDSRERERCMHALGKHSAGQGFDKCVMHATQLKNYYSQQTGRHVNMCLSLEVRLPLALAHDFT